MGEKIPKRVLRLISNDSVEIIKKVDDEEEQKREKYESRHNRVSSRARSQSPTPRMTSVEDKSINQRISEEMEFINDGSEPRNEHSSKPS